MQKKLSKTEKSKTKAKNKSLESSTIIKSVTAVVCTVVFCLSASSAMDAISEAISHKSALTDTVSADDISGGAAVAQNNAGGITDDLSQYNTASDIGDIPSDEDSSSASQSTASEEGKAGDMDKSSSAPSVPNSNDPLNYSVAQLVNYYNSCLKKTYTLPNLTIEKTEDIKIVIDDVTPGGEKVANFGNKIVNKYAKATDFKDTFKNGKSTTGGDDAEEFSMHASLAPEGVKNAAIKKSGNGYEIRILVAPEKATLDKKPTYNSQCSNPLDLGAVDLFGLEVTQADFNYPGTMLVAIVDSEGRATSAVCTMPMNGTGSGKFIISGSATVHGSMVKSAKFSF